MLNVLYFVIFVSVYQFCSCNDCTFSSYSGTPIFIQKFGKSNLLLPSTKGGIQLPNRQNLTAYCPDDFDNLIINNYEYKEVSEILIQCKNKALTFEPKNGRRGNYYGSSNRFNCTSSKTHVCEHAVEGCKATSYIHMDSIKKVSMVYAEVCYDLAELQAQFVHYVVCRSIARARTSGPILLHCSNGFSREDFYSVLMGILHNTPAYIKFAS